MEGAWLVSYLILWLLTLLLVLVVLAHSRLLGLLHHRFGPASARPLADGPKLGTRLEQVSGQWLNGTTWVRVFPASTETILVFLSPQCQTCNELMPHVKDFARAHPDVPIVLMSILEDRLMNQAYVQYQRLEKVPYVIAPKLAVQLDIEGALCPAPGSAGSGHRQGVGQPLRTPG